jgi:hypothetical protein
MMAKLWQMINMNYMILQCFTEDLTWGETVLFRSPREHSAHQMYDLPNQDTEFMQVVASV